MAWFRRRKDIVVEEPVAGRGFHLFGGRRHLATATYPLPKDMGEINRLDFQHYLLRAGAGGNYVSPIIAPTAILDVGSGSGRWGMELAAMFPAARVTGVDLVPSSVDEAQLLGNGLTERPENYSFTTANVLEGLPFSDASFDLVHQRLLITAIPRERWVGVIAELARVTRPGGWVELAECGVPERGGPGYTELWNSWITFLAKRDVDFTLGDRVGRMLAAGGLVNVRQRRLNFPMGDWGGRIGRSSATDCLAVGKALRAGVIAAGVLSEPDYDRLYTLATQEFSARSGAGILPFYIACGQKPA